MNKACLLFLGFWISFHFSAFALPPDDFEIIMERIFNDYQKSPNTPTLDQNVNELLNTLLPDGSWPDINYGDNSQTNWSPDIHLKRLGSMTKAYTRSSSSLFEDTALYGKIVQAMQFWTNLDPEPASTNWWYRSISVPQEVGRIVISMRFSQQGISQQLESDMIKWMLKSVPITTSPGKDGSNLTDICQHMIMRACLIEDGDLLSYAVTQSTNSIFITTGEGIQRDYSFRAHGPQLYIYGYGREYLSGIRNIAVYTTGTAYAITPEKIDIISGFTRKGFIKTARGAYSDYNAFGRGISRANATRTDINLIEQVKSFDLEVHENEYELAIQGMRGQIPLELSISPDNTHFWRSDYTVHHRPSYMFSVNSVSTRTVKTEMGNGENIKGHYLTEGSNFIAVTGDEYFNIYPVWDWNKIPGTTIPESESYPLRASWGTNPGKTSFVGGVSDGLYGASTFTMDDYQTKAKKSWFFFDDEIVAMGSGIHSTAPQTINTSINQSHLNGSVVTSFNQQPQILSSGTHQFTDEIGWVWHSKVGYFFPEATNLKLSNQVQSGSWSSINQTQSSEMITSEVFKIWIDHGQQPLQAKYTYIVVPGIESAADMANYDPQNISILSNNDSIQAVQHLGLGIVQVIFHQAGILHFGDYTVKASHPCVLMLKSIGNLSVDVIASDPTQALQSDLRIGFRFPGSDIFKMANMELPIVDRAGSSISSVIDLNSPEYEDIITPVTIIAVEDAFVRDGSYADTNYPTGNLVVKNDGVGWVREAFVKFDLSTVPSSLDSAIFQIRVNNANTTVEQTSWLFHFVTDNSWTENTLTWNNKPISTEVIAQIPGRPTGSFVNFPIPLELLNSLSTDRLLSIRITSTTVGSTTDAQFSSREHQTPSYRPAILAYPAPIPEGDLISKLPSADTFIQDSDSGGDAKDKNYGAAGFLASQKGGYQRVAYLKFNLGQLESAPIHANLRLHSLAAASSTTWEVYLLEDNSWEEGNGNWAGNGTYGLTWNNAPTIGELIVAQMGPNQSGPISFDLTSMLRDLEEDQVYSLRIVSTQAGIYTSFASKEASNESQRPTLEYILEKTQVIEDSTAVENSPPKPAVLLFPNPTKGFSMISSEKLIQSATIKDRFGNTLKEDYNINDYKYEVNLSNLKNGIYYVTVYGSDFQYTKKAIKRGQ